MVSALSGVLVLTGVSIASASVQSNWLPGHTYGVGSDIESPNHRYRVGVSADNGALLQVDLGTTPHRHCASWGTGGNYVVFDGKNLMLKTFAGDTKATILGTSGTAAFIDNNGRFVVGSKEIHGC